MTMSVIISLTTVNFIVLLTGILFYYSRTLDVNSINMNSKVELLILLFY